jgi:hypothetical protein
MKYDPKGKEPAELTFLKTFRKFRTFRKAIAFSHNICPPSLKTTFINIHYSRY